MHAVSQWLLLISGYKRCQTYFKFMICRHRRDQQPLHRKNAELRITAIRVCSNHREREGYSLGTSARRRLVSTDMMMTFQPCSTWTNAFADMLAEMQITTIRLAEIIPGIIKE